jgi:hypothetical protein
VIPPQIIRDEDGEPGTALIFHMYGEAIPVELNKAFQLFCASVGVTRAWKKPWKTLKAFNPGGFREYWDMMKKENATFGVDLSEVSSPYAWHYKP